ncbi:MAG: type III-A CRISPR-associated RAMP protein Csm3 [Candidatus Poribacteria bacterium]|nr:type III-A CRISPR-associated RAMP protein Csm3 [Candidatus Poribacteria bacterium]
MPSIQLHGKIFLQGTIRAVTGLHIGGNSDDLEIGGIDNPIIRNAFDRQPYIPGSSLRGKMRGLLDRHFNNNLNKSVGRDVRVHECNTLNDYNDCPVCQVFGVVPMGQSSGENLPTRLIVRDTFLDDDALDVLNNADTDTVYAEIKTEVAIDRITSAATPRQQERILAGTTFGPFQMIQSFYTQDQGDPNAQLENELQLFDTVLKGMELLADDYLGGSGSRGSGQIAFEDLKLTFKSRQCYEQAGCQPISIAPGAQTIQALRQSDYITEVLAAIRGKAVSPD